MKTKILLTSFQTWLPHQKSNSSDDLLAKIQKGNHFDDVSLFFLRNLPVDIEAASERVIAEINDLRPNVIICCGMAEKRHKPTLESNAICQDERLHTSIDLTALTNKLMITEISHNAGKFVCEGLYYKILKYIQTQEQDLHCIFAHIPLLERSDLGLILSDFDRIFLTLSDWLTDSIKTSKNIQSRSASI